MRKKKKWDLERVDGAVMWGDKLLAIGERERGRAARSGGGLKPPSAKLSTLPPPHLFQPHPAFSVCSARCGPGVPSALRRQTSDACVAILCTSECLVTALTGVKGSTVMVGSFHCIRQYCDGFVWQVTQEECHVPKGLEESSRSLWNPRRRHRLPKADSQKSTPTKVCLYSSTPLQSSFAL